MHASRLQGPPGENRNAVVVEPAEPRATLSILLSAHQLSVREGEGGQAGAPRRIDPSHF